MGDHDSKALYNLRLNSMRVHFVSRIAYEIAPNKFLFSLTFSLNISIIKIGNGDPQTWFAKIYVKTHLTGQKLQMCFLFIYLLKIITNIIKANTTIVSVIKPNNNKYIRLNKIDSIICTPPFSQHIVVD